MKTKGVKTENQVIHDHVYSLELLNFIVIQYLLTYPIIFL